MPLPIHPTLRYTVRLEYIEPISKRVEGETLFMSETEFEGLYNQIIEEHKETILHDLNLPIEEWGERYQLNHFGHSDILSDAVVALLKKEEVPVERDLVCLYLCELRYDCTAKEVADAILKVTRSPEKEICSEIMAMWGVMLRDTYIADQLQAIVGKPTLNHELEQLLKEPTQDSLRRLKKRLTSLSDTWELSTISNGYQRSVILAKFLVDCPLISLATIDFAKAMNILSRYFGLKPTTYKRNILLPTSKNTESLTDAQRSFHQRITQKWHEFSKSL